MNHLSPVCLSLTTNLRCIGFTPGQFVALIIPPAIEVITSLCFIYLYSGPVRRPQILLVADSISYFTWTLLDMLSRVVLARTSLSTFRTLDSLVGAVSFTPILFYSFYLYRLSFRDFIPTLPRKHQPYLEISLPVLMLVAVTMNEVSSFVGIHLGSVPNQPPVQFPLDDESLWLALSRSSLTIYAIMQFLFFLLSFSRLSRACLHQRRIEITHSDEQHYFNGIPWITSGIIIGVIETTAGFTWVSFGVTLARRILHLIARTTLMFGLLKGLDESENFENLVDERRGPSRITRRISHILCFTPQQNTFRRISSEHSPMDNPLSVEKQSRKQRVTVHYENGHAPCLDIRFSVLDFPAQAALTDTDQQRRRSLSGSIQSYAGAGTSTQPREKNFSDDMAAVRNDKRRTKSEAVNSDSHRHVDPDSDWMRPPEHTRERQESGGTISDSLSVVRDLERRFPNLPPRVTGKYRGSILGENFEEDPFPVVGISRQSSLRQDGGAQNPSEEGGATVTVTLSSSGSIKRKPAPPLLDHIAYISERHTRPTSTWGGLTAGSPMAPNSPSKGTTVCSSDATLAGEPSTPRSRRRTARDVLKRASRALSDASIRSAEWLASASSPRSARAPLTATEIEMYRRGTLGPGSHHLPGADEASAGENLLPIANRTSADDVGIHPKPPSQPRINVGM